jgi:regulatory protein
MLLAGIQRTEPKPRYQLKTCWQDNKTKGLTMPTSSPSNIRKIALDLLSRREHSVLELSQKLRRKNFDSTHIQALIETLTKEGLLSNSRYIENFIHYRRNKGYGPLRIQAELLDRGISKELIEQQLNITDNEWLHEAKRVWQKRFKNNIPNDFKTRAQQMRFLHYRGFTHEQIESIFNGLHYQRDSQPFP